MNSLTLDSQMLNDLYGGSDDDVRFILYDYLDKHAQIINSFNEAYNNGAGSLSKCAHQHAAAFSYIGIPQLTEVCKNFEQACKNAPDTTVLTAGFERLISVIDQSALLVKQELTRLETARVK